PGTQEQQLIHQRIVDELENGIVTQETKNEMLEIINRMIHEEGIDSLILGCTELQMILTQPDVNVAHLDTVDIHVDKMIEELFKYRYLCSNILFAAVFCIVFISY